MEKYSFNVNEKIKFELIQGDKYKFDLLELDDYMIQEIFFEDTIQNEDYISKKIENGVCIIKTNVEYDETNVEIEFNINEQLYNKLVQETCELMNE